MSFHDDLAHLHDEAAGVFDLLVADPPMVARLLGYAIAGDAYAAALARAIANVGAGVAKAPRRRPMLCASCPRPLKRDKYTTVLAVPRRDDPTKALGLGICHRCADARNHAAVTDRAVTALRNIWPDGRVIDAPHGGGGGVH